MVSKKIQKTDKSQSLRSYAYSVAAGLVVEIILRMMK